MTNDYFFVRKQKMVKTFKKLFPYTSHQTQSKNEKPQLATPNNALNNFDLTQRTLNSQILIQYKKHYQNKHNITLDNENWLIFYLIDDYLGGTYPKFDKQLDRFLVDLQDFMIVHLYDVCGKNYDRALRCVDNVVAFSKLLVEIRKIDPNAKGIRSDHPFVKQLTQKQKDFQSFILFACLENATTFDDTLLTIYSFLHPSIELYFTYLVTNFFAVYNLKNHYLNILAKKRKLLEPESFITNKRC